MNHEEFTSWKLLKSNYKRGYQISQTICRIVTPTKKLCPPFFNFRNFKGLTKALLSHGKYIEIYWRTNNLRPQHYWNWNPEGREDQIIETFCRIGPPSQKFGPSFLILLKFQNFQKGTAGSSRMHWNLMNYKEFWSLKLLKLKYRRRTK